MSKRVLFAVTAILLMVSGCGGSKGGHSAGSSTPHPNPFAGEKAWVAYHTTHNDLESVGLVHPDGTENHQVTTDVPSQQQQLLPDWSPDGKRLVFATHPLHQFHSCCPQSNLYRMHPDGSGMEQLTRYEGDGLRATQPRYTPDATACKRPPIEANASIDNRLNTSGRKSLNFEGLTYS